MKLITFLRLVLCVEDSIPITVVNNHRKARDLVINPTNIKLNGRSISSNNIEKIALVSPLTNKSTNAKVVKIGINPNSTFSRSEVLVDVYIKGGMTLRRSLPIEKITNNNIVIGDISCHSIIKISDIGLLSTIILGQKKTVLH